MSESNETKKTVVVNLFSGSGTGKSTLASALFSELKIKSHNVELVREYIKEWAHENRKPGKFDQLFILGNQSRNEGHLYGKMDILITDSPLLLIPFYEQFLIHTSIVEPTVLNFMKYAEQNGVTYLNFWLERLDTFDTRGRYETAEQAKEIDFQLRSWLESKSIKLIDLPKSHEDRVRIVLEHLGIDHSAKR